MSEEGRQPRRQTHVQTDNTDTEANKHTKTTKVQKDSYVKSLCSDDESPTGDKRKSQPEATREEKKKRRRRRRRRRREE